MKRNELTEPVVIKRYKIQGTSFTTNNKKFYHQLLLLRNHGLIDRDTVKISGFNSRLDTFQAVVGNWLLPKAKMIANTRIKIKGLIPAVYIYTSGCAPRA